MISIRRNLRRSLLVSVTLVTAVAAVWSYHDTRDQIDELFDAELAQTARTMVALYFEHGGTTASEPGLELSSPKIPDNWTDSPTAAGHPYEKKLGFQIWNRDGQPLMGMKTQGVRLELDPDAGYGVHDGGDHQWRTFTLYDDRHQVWATAAQRDDVRDELTWQIAMRDLMPPVIGTLIIALVIPFFIARGFSPLLRVSRQIAARKPSYLEPIDASQTPEEIGGMVKALNGVFARLAETLEKERRFTANAAHELRTPLAAIKVHAQNLLSEEIEPEARQGARSIIHGVDRMTRVVEQLLTLSRLESGQAVTRQSVNLERLGRELQRDLQPVLMQRDITLTLEVADGLHLESYENGLYVLMRNLLDNAVRYTPQGGQVRLAISRASDHVLIDVADSGPGIATGDRERVFERFVRLAGQKTSGSGLGLAIVRELVERLGGTIELADTTLPADSGLSVKVELPVA
ncbi:ATP-binding protein [Salinicola rhizosphaerae]|uniref:histidine kinase n=1 Tax=Salinicola rhizosphaerae TaxID=1443141 RepID=A0ABQ3E8U3_9GAMM|nr:ATP-binding protein [Salinicola rhizosphaerae]GHB28625.1 two-component sensor histidine kinase [Salinicola rhizosphaerae]